MSIAIVDLVFKGSIAITVALSLWGCGGSGGDGAEVAKTPPLPASGVAMPSGPSGPSVPAAPAVVLPRPVLSFTDTGLSVTDGVTRIGAWQVSSLQAWEYSFDQGATWIRGQGDYFDVLGDGAKTIWVRARDDLGNTSEIVMVSCVLDTMAPAPLQLDFAAEETTRIVRIGGLEDQGRWEYSLDEQQSWRPGSGEHLAILGNGLSLLWLRQVDLAGNPSTAQQLELAMPSGSAWHEASGNPLQPSLLWPQQARTVLLHGTVVRGDPDYIHWQTPAGHVLQSMRLVRYVSSDPIAFYALQRAPVFDAGVDVSRMLAYGHMGPADLGRNVLVGVSPVHLREGPMTLWFQQTGPEPTVYALELVFEPVE